MINEVFSKENLPSEIILSGPRYGNVVSVIIPTYNYAHFLKQCLDSVVSQQVAGMEIILVDDGSTDNTREVIAPYVNRIKYIFQKNQGLSAARNTGIRNSSGEWLLFLDSDDILGPDIIASHLSFIDQNPDVRLVVCRNRIFKRMSPDEDSKVQEQWRLYTKHLDVHLCHLNIAPPHAFLIHRNAVTETGWFDTQLRACEDYDFWFRAALKGFIPRYNPHGCVYYRHHSKSMSANLENQFRHDKILHEKNSKRLDEFPEYPQGRRMEGLLAFSSGAMRTAFFLKNYDKSGADELMTLALKWITEIKEIKIIRRHYNQLLTNLFLFRILEYLHFTDLKCLDSAREIHHALFQVFKKSCLPSSKYSLIAEAIKTCLWGSDKQCAEVRELRDFLRKWIKPFDFILSK
jgi:glycosyltransferase involved in cell wall biosynthesis